MNEVKNPSHPYHNVTKQMANLFEAYLAEQSQRRKLEDRIKYLEQRNERLCRRIEQRDKEVV